MVQQGVKISGNQNLVINTYLIIIIYVTETITKHLATCPIIPALYIMCIMLLLVERNPPKEVDKLEASKRKLEFQIREVDLKLR